MDRDNANATRLRVNRIALIQQLDTQELVPKLVRARVLSIDHDIQYINQGTSRIDRARRLIDCLLIPISIGKEAERGDRPANWYLIFRSILLENSSTYGDLVTALDNTIIRVPDFAQRISEAFADKTNIQRSDEFRNNVNKDLLRTSVPTKDTEQNKSSHTGINQEQITKIEFDRYAMNKILIEGNFQKVIDNLTYHSQVLKMKILIYFKIIFYRFLNVYLINYLNQINPMIVNNFKSNNKHLIICDVLN